MPLLCALGLLGLLTLSPRLLRALGPLVVCGLLVLGALLISLPLTARLATLRGVLDALLALSAWHLGPPTWLSIGLGWLLGFLMLLRSLSWLLEVLRRPLRNTLLRCVWLGSLLLSRRLELLTGSLLAPLPAAHLLRLLLERLLGLLSPRRLWGARLAPWILLWLLLGLSRLALRAPSPRRLLRLAPSWLRALWRSALRRGRRRALALREESPRLRVSVLALGLLPLHLTELRRVTAIGRISVGGPTASLP